MASIPKEIPNNSRPQSKDICYTHCLSEYTCAGNFSSSLHMLYVIFVHSHLYFKNPHLVTHFFLPGTFICPHFCQYLPQSIRQPVSSKTKTATREQVGLLYKLNTRTLQKFRLPPSLRWTCWAVQRVDSAGSEEARVFDCGMGVWKRVSRRESSYSAWVVDVLETVATSWEIYILADIINSPRAIFFPSPHLSVCTWHTHTCWIYCACAKNTI